MLYYSYEIVKDRAVMSVEVPPCSDYLSITRPTSNASTSRTFSSSFLLQFVQGPICFWFKQLTTCPYENFTVLTCLEHDRQITR